MLKIKNDGLTTKNLRKMKNKILLLLLLTGCIDLLLVSCCEGFVLDYLVFDQVLFENTNEGVFLSDNEVVVFEDFVLACRFDTHTIAARNFTSGTLGTAYAMQPCPKDGELGLKNDIVSVVISASHEVLGIPAGQALNIDGNIKIFSSLDNVNSQRYNETFDRWIDAMNTSDYYINTRTYFQFQENIAADELLKFKIQLTLSDGSIIETETPNIKID